MAQNHKSIILGSASPRRKELLAGLDLAFTVDTENTFIESVDADLQADQVPLAMSKGKSHGFHRPLTASEILITSDTVVVVSDDNGKKEVLGKPHDREAAFGMLRKLSGRSHEVITAVTIRDASHEKSFCDTAKVYFRQMTDEEISYYIDTYKPFDKAGAYGIQEWIGYAAIEKIEGSFFTVMGFPTEKVFEALKEFKA